MNNDGTNRLALEIQAKLLPHLEGINEFEQNVNSLPSRMKSRVSETVKSEDFQGSLNEEQKKAADAWLKYSQELYKPIQEKTKHIIDDYFVDLSGGKLTKQQQGKHVRNLEKLKLDSEKLEEKLIDDLRSYNKGLNDNKFSPEQIQIIAASMKGARGEIIEEVDAIKKSFTELNSAINTTNKETASFLETAKRGGILALGYNVSKQLLDLELKGQLVGKEIEAQYKTAFNLQSPFQMYGEKKSAELFERTRERSFQAEKQGTLVGGGLGLAAALTALLMTGTGVGTIPGLAILGGGIIGGTSLGKDVFGNIAQQENVTDTGEVQAALKLINQLTSGANSLVESAKSFEISARKLSARFGEDLRGSSGLGYTADQELAYKAASGEARGLFNRNLYDEQLKFIRAYGVDPNAIMDISRMSRLTGEEYGADYLVNARRISKGLFGEKSDEARVLDILSAQKEILLKLLQVGVDTKDSLKFAELPKLFMGVDSPFGRSGEMGERTFRGLQSLTQPGSQAEEALLFQALGQYGLTGEKGYFHRKAQGILSPENLGDILTTYRDKLGGSQQLAELFLRNKGGQIDEPVLMNLSKLLAGESIRLNVGERDKPKFEEMNIDKIIEKFSGEWKKLTPDKVNDILAGDLKGKITQYESVDEEIRRQNLKTAENFRETILEAQKKSADFWEIMGKSATAQKSMTEALDQGIKETVSFLVRKGIIDDPELINKEYHNKKYDLIYRMTAEATGEKTDDMLSNGRDLQKYISDMAKIISDKVTTHKTVVDPLGGMHRLEISGQEEIDYHKNEFEREIQKLDEERNNLQKPVIQPEEKSKLDYDKSAGDSTSGNSQNIGQTISNEIQNGQNQLINEISRLTDAIQFDNEKEFTHKFTVVNEDLENPIAGYFS